MGRTKEDKLVEAVIDDNFREVTSLLAKGAPVGIDIINSLLYYAALQGHIRLVELYTHCGSQRRSDRESSGRRSGRG